MSNIQSVAKAVAGGIVGIATYILANGVTIDDPMWWAAAAIFMGAGYGIVWAVPNR